jgi:hypothetical protein
VSDDDLEYLTTLLLERETPLTTEQLAFALMEKRLQDERAALEERYKDALFYNPSRSYEVGQRLIFPTFDYATGFVVGVRSGDNPDYGDFKVISIQFENPTLNRPDKPREFAASLSVPHKLSQETNNGAKPYSSDEEVTADEIMRELREPIVDTLEKRLAAIDTLAHLVRQWFPRDLLLDVNPGYLNLAEAVLDMSGGGPLPTEDILRQMGGLGDAPTSLQIFSLNYALNRDRRFDEVGPAGEVLWYLARLEPPEVLQVPPMLRYTPIDYDRSLLPPEMLALEAEIGDELSPSDIEIPAYQSDVTLNYPHRRVGTLPLNARTRKVFPTARRTSRIWIALVDGQDGEEFTGWVVHQECYVFGFAPFYRKHRLPIGAHVNVSNVDEPGKIVVNFNAYRPRTEWIRLIAPKNDQLHFENHKRSIGSDYDELMILGVDDLQAVDSLYQATPQQQKSLASILKTLIPELGRLTPQGTVHAKTLYSAVNILRRCPPGPIFATLVANPDFQNVGGHYWKLSDPS